MRQTWPSNRLGGGHIHVCMYVCKYIYVHYIDMYIWVLHLNIEQKALEVFFKKDSSSMTGLANSLYLSLIKKLCKKLDKASFCKADLSSVTQESWKLIDEEYCFQFMTSIPERLEAMIQAKYFSFGWWFHLFCLIFCLKTDTINYNLIHSNVKQLNKCFDLCLWFILYLIKQLKRGIPYFFPVFELHFHALPSNNQQVEQPLQFPVHLKCLNLSNDIYAFPG